MIIANLEKKEYMSLWSPNDFQTVEFMGKLLIGLIGTPPPPNKPKVHSFQGKWCGEKIVGCYDLDEFESWLLAHGDSIEHYRDRTYEFVVEYQMRFDEINGNIPRA
jgi:hypothetical protein